MENTSLEVITENAPIAEQETAVDNNEPKGKFLSFTLVDGYLRGEHRCRFELHATGCRDLRKAQATQPHYEILGREAARHDDCLDSVIAQGIEDLGGTIGRKDIWVQPCCNIKRMRAIGRA